MSESAEARATFQSLQDRIDALESERAAARDALGASPVGVGLGIAVVLLSAMSWAQSRDGDLTMTLWDLAEHGGWQGTVTVLAVVLLGVGSVVVSASARPSRAGLRLSSALAAVVVALVGAVGGVLPTVDTALGDPVAAGSGPARWLTMAAVLALLLTHLVRLGRLREATPATTA